MSQWSLSPLVEVIACHLFNAKPSPEPIIVYCKFWTAIGEILIKVQQFSCEELYLICCLQMVAISIKHGNFLRYLIVSFPDLDNTINSLGSNDTIWQHRFGSALAQVMICGLTAPSHYLNQCWLIISEVHWLWGQSTSHQSLELVWKIAYLKFHQNLPGANEFSK